MKVSLNWLKEYAPINKDITELSDSLTMAGLEIEKVESRFEYLNEVIVAKVNSAKKHPDADKLSICEVDTGEKVIQVVCGAPNVRDGLTVALALPGTILPTTEGKPLKKGKIRGEKSEGMICSAIELQIGVDADGIIELDTNLTIGDTLLKALSLEDYTLEIGLTPNRPDCLGLIGVAREIAAMENTSVKFPEVKDLAASGDINEHVSVTIEDPELCPRYTAALILDAKVADSPFWLQDRLLSVGLTPINNIVDITNFVMMETGQPLHAFDLDHLEESRIVVKRANEGDKFTTLDDKERTLSSETLMICDGKKPVAVGGVMGGQNSEIGDNTTKVLLESAYFSPTSIRKTAKKLNLGTDATHRFERGVDPEGTLFALKRAAALIAELTGGKLVSGVIDENPIKHKRTELNLSMMQTNRALGLKLSIEEIKKHLESVEFEVSIKDEDTLFVIAPGFRVDVSRPVDLMEEVARLEGYDKIPVTHPVAPSVSALPPKVTFYRDKIKDMLLGLGMTEAINYSFIGDNNADLLMLPENDDRRKMLGILNPLTEDQGVMRTSVIPGLLQNMKHNNANQNKTLKLFEFGNIFISNGQNQQPIETEMLAGVITGGTKDPVWYQKEDSVSFYDAKGIVEELLERLKIENVTYTSLSVDECLYTRKGYSAKIISGNKEIGLIGKVKTEVKENFDLKQDAFIFELSYENLLSAVPESLNTYPLPIYPSVTRDITMIVEKDVEAGDILKEFKGFKEKLFESVRVSDLYEGDNIEEGYKSLSFRLTYRSENTTLKDKKVNKIHTNMSKRIIEKFNAKLP
ncbi:MAG: phenylalanine--tRNA ligase subunit beta [Deltaproteobacteria bacterium]|nr:phenylalanine--tRNA ligase subunit beta [Deltaproteobacteria bacterium]